jgi:predicted nuclease of restriction endonuclease-like RecB superfamily
MALFPAERMEALQKAAKNLSISVQDLEKSMWADLEENQILKEFNPPAPAELLRQYNISLTQTLLLRAVDLDIWITGGFQRVLWKILRSGLMYSLEDMQEKKAEKRK